MQSAFEIGRSHNILYYLFDAPFLRGLERRWVDFFLAFTVYMAGLEVVIKFIGIYATSELQLQTADLISLFLILQLSAAAGARWPAADRENSGRASGT